MFPKDNYTTQSINKLRILSAWKDNIYVGPKTIYLDINNFCNLNCIFCWEHSPFIHSKKFKKRNILDFATIMKIVDAAAQLKTDQIAISGDGEPLLHPQIKEIISYIKGKKIELQLTTNCTFKADLIPHISHINYLQVNLSAANEKSYYLIHNPKDTEGFGKIIKNLKILAALRKKYNYPFIEITYIVNNANYKGISEMFDLVKKLKINQLTLIPVETTDSTKKISLDQKEIAQFLKICKKINANKFIFTHNLKNILRGFTNYEKSPYNFNQCFTGWFNLFIDFKQSVRICCHNERLVVGNLKKHSLEQIWNGKYTQLMRLRCKYDFNINKQPWKDKCKWCYWHKTNTLIKEEIKKLKNGGIFT